MVLPRFTENRTIWIFCTVNKKNKVGPCSQKTLARTDLFLYENRQTWRKFGL